MADISKIKLPSGAEFVIKDAAARLGLLEKQAKIGDGTPTSPASGGTSPITNGQVYEALPRVATSSADGLLTAADKTKLDNIGVIIVTQDAVTHKVAIRDFIGIPSVIQNSAGQVEIS